MKQLDIGSRLLREIAFLRTYAETLPNGKKETVEQTYDRVMNMHIDKFPHLAEDIKKTFDVVRRELAMPSMRSMQFAGYPILRSNCRIHNCSYTSIESFKDIADIAWIAMNGSGVGFSVQMRHVSKLPSINTTNSSETFLIPDSKEGWSDSILLLLVNPAQNFDYSLIRKKGTPLSTGGTASGPESLALMHDRVRSTLRLAVGRKLRSIEVYDILCHIGDLIVCGGVRRTAMICLFDEFDNEMLSSKYGTWWVENPQRGRSNNSAVIHRDDPEVFGKISKVLDCCFKSNAGEPAVYLTNDYDYGINPCGEISLPPRSFCNLTEINASACQTKEDFFLAAEAAAIIGTLQASYTKFSYIDARWQENCEREALLGISITGQSEAQHILTEENLRKAANIATKVNEEWAKKLNINPAARICCTKPSGSTSAFLGTTSGIHAAHDDFFLRRVRLDKSSPLAQHFYMFFGLGEPNSQSVLEQEWSNVDQVVVTVPICKKGAIKRGDEGAIDLLERVKSIHKNWIVPAHKTGANTHNVSVTVSYREEEKEAIKRWMIDNYKVYSGIALLPYNGGSHQQMPFESITESEYNEWVAKYPDNLYMDMIDFSNTEDTRKGEAACGANGCELI